MVLGFNKSLKLRFQYSFPQNKSDISEMSTKYNCNLYVSPVKAVLHIIVCAHYFPIIFIKYHPIRLKKMDVKTFYVSIVVADVLIRFRPHIPEHPF